MSNPLFSSIHNHTVFCDGKDDIETMCRAAYENKLHSIGFSAHAPVPKVLGSTDWHISEEKIDEYISEINEAKKRWQGKLQVFIGFEADYIKGYRTPNDSDLKAINPDYIIGSVHYIIPANGAKPFTVDGTLDEFENGLCDGFNGNIEALINCYYDCIAEMIENGGFDVLGHADLLKKNCHNRIITQEEIESVRQMEIAVACAKKNIIAEVNTGGLNRGKIKDVYPSVSFLSYFCKNNVKVTITSDAHRAVHICGNYDFALKAIKSAGFSEHAVLFDKIDGELQWKDEKIF